MANFCGQLRFPLIVMKATKILIVDADKKYRKLIDRVLRRRSNFEIVGEASDGLEAVRKADKLQPDLILLGTDLTRLDGIEACRRICKLSPKPKILFITVDHSAEALEEAFRLGAQGCLHRLDVADELFEAVDAVMDGELFASTHTEYYKNPDRLIGYGASGKRCQECLGLSALYREAVDEFRQRVNELSQAGIAYEFDIFTKLFEKCEASHRQCTRARDKLIGHLRQQHESG